MRGNIIKGAFIFLAGGAAGYFLAYKNLKDVYAQIAQDEINSVKKFYRDQMQNSVSGEGMPENEELEEKVIKYTDIDRKTDYDNILDFVSSRFKPGQTIVNDEGPRDDGPVEDDCEYDDYHPGDWAPYVISLEDFTVEKNYYDKLSITYYEADDVLVDEQEEIISDPVSLIGEDALECFGEMSDDPDTVYIRNDKLSVDYEVTRTNKSYTETVLGYEDEQPRRRHHNNGNE